MKASVYREFGPPEVLKLEEVPKPVPKDNEILVKVHAAAVGFGDLFARDAKNRTLREFYMPTPLFPVIKMTFGLSKPKIRILGAEFAGEIESTGHNVTRFKNGDRVYGYLGQKMGANAAYLCMPENSTVALMPANMTYEEAAAVPYGALTALALLRKANIRLGQKVLINGASGGIGAAGVQLAKYYGAEVSGVCGTLRLEYVKTLGADKVIDYTREDFTKNGLTYDVVFDILGKSSFSRCKNSLKPKGIYFPVSFKTRQFFQMFWTGMRGGKKVLCQFASDNAQDLVFITGLIEAGKYKTLVDKVFPLEQVAAAHRYMEEGKARGKVVIKVAE
jgi:NADPH:quinone reductase-like Zn-dependent oxidoreductase